MKKIIKPEVGLALNDNINQNVPSNEVHTEKMTENVEQIKQNKGQTFIEKAEKLKEVYSNNVTIATDVMKDIKSGKAINVGAVKKAVSSLVDNVLQNTDTMVTLSKIKKFDEYTYKHSVNVSILTITLGNYLNFSRNELEIVGMGGILHDCGKMKIPNEILNKAGKLTDLEFTTMKKHPLYGVELLNSTGIFDRRSVLMVLQHHEKYSGGGYPSGVQGNRISTFGMMTAIADVYDALTSERVYKKAESPFSALQKLYKDKGRHFHPNFVEYFIHAVGIYPVGSLVRLKNKFIGIVIATNKSNLRYPKILVVIDGNNGRLERPIIMNDNPPDTEESDEWTISEIIEESSEEEEGKEGNVNESNAWEISKVLEPENCEIDVEYYMQNFKNIQTEAA